MKADVDELPRAVCAKVPERPDFRTLFESELGYVWNTLRRLGVPERDRADVGHEVFVAVHRKLASYDPARALRPWLFAFAFRCASDYRRRSTNRFELLAAEDGGFAETIQDPSPGADDVVGDRTLLEKALDRLSAEHRALIVLHEIEGRPVAELAREFDIPLQTVYSRLRAARDELVRVCAQLGMLDGEVT